MIDRLTDLRIRPNRDFFNITPEEVYGIFEDIAKLFDDAELELHIANKEEDECARRSNTTFAMLGLKPGDVITWWNDPSIEAKVIDGKSKVDEWNGDLYSTYSLYCAMRNSGKKRPPNNTSVFCAFCRKGDTISLNALRETLGV